MTLLSAFVLAATFHPASAPELALGDWLVVVDAEAAKDLEGTARRLVGDGRLKRVWPSVPGFLATVSFDDAKALSSAPRVRGVFQDVRLERPFSTPLPDCSQGPVMGGPVQSPLVPQTITCVDPDPQNPTGVCTDNWGLDRIDGSGLDGRYHPPRDGAGVRLFVIDTGLYAQHQEFQGRVGQGFNATGGGSTDDCDSWAHGTHVAAIAAGRRFGVAKGATVHPVRVAGCPLSLAISSLVSAFDWIAQVHGSTLTGPAVATMSINASLPEFREPSQPLGLAIAAALASGVVVVESAGNQATAACDWSTAVPGAIIVGGSDEFDTPWERRAGDPNYAGWCPPDCGSNTGSCVTLFAPAAHIVSAWFGMSPSPTNTCRLSGTSMAAPAVAGAAALHLQANPSATPAQVKAALVMRATASLTQLPANTPNALLSIVEGSVSATVSPPTLDFGSATMGPATTRTVTLTSTGSIPLRPLSRSISGPGVGDYVVVRDGCRGQTVSTTCSIDVDFSPTASGPRTATLSITTNAPTSPHLIALSGIGLPPRLTVQRVGAGQGVVRSQPAGIDCGSTCEASFTAGTQVTLVATAAADSTFVDWQGCTGDATCVVTLAGSQTAIARFEPRDAGADGDAGAPDDDAGVDAGAPMTADASVPSDAGVDAGTPSPRPDAGARLDAGTDGGSGDAPNRPCGCSGGLTAAPLLWLALALVATRRPASSRTSSRP